MPGQKQYSAPLDPSGEGYAVPSKVSSLVSLGSTMHPMTGLYPAPDNTNGPLKTDTHQVQGAPTTTGLQFFAWDSGVFRTQGMNWMAANTAANTSGKSAAINGSTPRVWGFGTSQPNLIESDHDFAFVTDSAVVVVEYFHWNGYTGSNQNDMRWMVEHEGALRQLRSNLFPLVPMPSSVSTGSGLHNRRLTFSEQRERQHRVMLPANCFVTGVWIDTSATIRKAPPAFLFTYNGDSWGEPYRNNPSMQSPIAGAFPTGNFTTTGLPAELCIATGWVCARVAQGGTGLFNANESPNASRGLAFATATNDSVFHGDKRLNDAATKFGALSPLWLDVGGWNDGDLPGTPFQANYQARAALGLDSLKSKGFKAVVGVSIQPVGSAATLDANRAASLQGQKAAYLARTDSVGDGFVRGFLDLTPMWPNVSTSGQRGNNVNSADTIHLHSKGAELVSRYIVAGLRPMTIPQSLVNAQLAAAA